MSFPRSISSDILYIPYLVFVFLPSFYDCFEFVSSPFEPRVHANRSSEALFRWRYILGNAQASSLKVQCFYYFNNFKSTEVLVQKNSHDKNMFLVKNLPGNSFTTVTPYNEMVNNGGVDHSVVGFKIMQAQTSHPTDYGCRGIYNDLAREQLDAKTSPTKKLVILDPPKLTRCLENVNSQMKEGKDLQISCFASGNPLPTVACTLYSETGAELNKIPQRKAHNISAQSFLNIPRTAKEIVCVADGGQFTGRVNKTMLITVLHPPTAPKLVEFISADNHSSLNIRWSEIPTNETGGQILGYKINYYTSDGSGFPKTKTLPLNTIPLSDGFYHYVLAGLDASKEYTLQVYGYNQNFIGDRHQPLKQIPSLVPLKSKTSKANEIGIIVGGIIGGIAFIAIIVVICIFVMNHRKKRASLPTSHVDDVVDYMPTIGSIAMSHDNKNFEPSRNEYPDIVNDANLSANLDSVNAYANKSYV